MVEEKDRLADYLAEIPNFLSIFIFSIFFNIASPILIEISKSTSILTTNLILFWVIYFLSGYILGVVWIQANQFILVSKVRNKERIITIFLTFYPIGAFIASFISSSIISAGFSWRSIFYIVIFMISINIILYIILLGRKSENAAIQNEAKLPLKEIFTDKTKNLIFILLFLAVCFYCSSETILATWTPTFLREARNLPVQPASLALNLFWLFVIIGRVIVLIIAGRIKSTKIMLVISTLAIISMIAVAFIYNKYLIFILISIAGLGYSAMFPLLISAGSTLYEKGRGILVTFLFLASNIGVASAPAITKFSSKASMQLSISFSFILMAIVSIIVLMITYLFNRRTGNFINQGPIKQI